MYLPSDELNLYRDHARMQLHCRQELVYEVVEQGREVSSNQLVPPLLEVLLHEYVALLRQL